MKDESGTTRDLTREMGLMVLSTKGRISKSTCCRVVSVFPFLNHAGALVNMHFPCKRM